MQARRLVRVAFRLHARFAGTWTSALLVPSCGVGSFVRISPPNRAASILGVAKHANARRQIERVSGWVGHEHCGRIGTRLRIRGALDGLVHLISPRAYADLRQAFRI